MVSKQLYVSIDRSIDRFSQDEGRLSSLLAPSRAAVYLGQLILDERVNEGSPKSDISMHSNHTAICVKRPNKQAQHWVSHRIQIAFHSSAYKCSSKCTYPAFYVCCLGRWVPRIVADLAATRIG